MLSLVLINILCYGKKQLSNVTQDTDNINQKPASYILAIGSKGSIFNDILHISNKWPT